MNTEVSTADKVLQLTIELAETRDRKKASVKGYNEEIKRIAAEIAELIVDDKETATVE
jgi:N-acetylglutamate synthase/N-acetylornithine aminotransferase